MQMIDGFGWTIRLISNIYINIIKIVIRMAGELESDSVALERVREYEDLPQVLQKKTNFKQKHPTQEADWESEVPLAENWPSTGEIKFDG